jgi:citrate lyase beta subunit
MLMTSCVWKLSREVRQEADIQLRTRNIQAIALPKTTSADHINWLVSRIEHLSPSHKLKSKEEGIKIIAMIENARGMINIEEMAKAGEGYLDGLLVRYVISPSGLG